MHKIINEVYEYGIEYLLRKIKEPFTRRSARNRCKRCKRYDFNKMYWNCLECELCCHLINHYLHERDGAGVRIGQIDREVSNIFARHFKKQINKAKADTKAPSDDHMRERKIFAGNKGWK